MQTLEERLSKLEQKIQTQEDVEDIRRLKLLYCRYADAGSKEHSPEKLGELFLDDGIWEMPGGILVGPKAIGAGVRASQQNLDFSLHYVINENIEVTGDTATASWYMLCPLRTKGAFEPFWLGGWYFENFVRTQSGWRFKHVKIELLLWPKQIPEFVAKEER
jgi:hypothetical protein